MEKNIEPIKVRIKTQEIDMPKINLKKFVGKSACIVSVDEMKGKFGYYVEIRTEVLESLNKGKSETIDIQAKRLFSLFEDKDGKIGWGKDTKLGVFLASKGVKHYNDLLGKEVVLQLDIKDNGSEFLSFI